MAASKDVMIMGDDPYVGSGFLSRENDYGRSKEKRKSRDWEKMRSDPKKFAEQISYEFGLPKDLVLYMYEKKNAAIGSTFSSEGARTKGVIASLLNNFDTAQSSISLEYGDGDRSKDANSEKLVIVDNSKSVDELFKSLNESGVIPVTNSKQWDLLSTEENFVKDRDNQVYDDLSNWSATALDLERRDSKEVLNNTYQKIIDSGDLTDDQRVDLDSSYNELQLSAENKMYKNDGPGTQSNSNLVRGDNQGQDNAIKDALVNNKSGQTIESSDADAGRARASKLRELQMSGKYTTEELNYFNATGSLPQGSTQIGTSASNEGNAGQSNKNAYNALLNPDNNITVPDDTDGQTDPSNTDDSLKSDNSSSSEDELELDSESFSGTLSPESKYRALLEGQLANGLSDSLAGRPSNSLLAGERMGAETLARASADNIAAGSQGVSNAGMIGQGAAQNANQQINNANLRVLGDLSAKNTAARGLEQKEARAQTQQFLEYSEGARRSKATEDNMKLGSMLDWYKEVKGTHAGQAETLMEGMRDITGTELSAEQEAFQKEQANISSQNTFTASTAQSYLDNNDYRSLASEFKIDPLTGLYVHTNGNGDISLLDAATNAKVKAALSFGGINGFEYDVNGNVVANNSYSPSDFSGQLSQAFNSKNFDAINKLSAYIPDYGTGDTAPYDIRDAGHKIGEVIEFNGEPVRIAYISNTSVQVQDNNGDFFTIGG